MWRGGMCGEFCVSSFYEALNHNGPVSCPADFLWKSKVPSKVAFFMWVLFHGKPPTQDLLQARGITFVNRCSLCLQEDESCDHLFLHCEYSFRVWGRCLQRFNRHWVHHSSIHSLIWEWSQANGPGLSQRGRELWK